MLFRNARILTFKNLLLLFCLVFLFSDERTATPSRSLARARGTPFRYKPYFPEYSVRILRQKFKAVNPRVILRQNLLRLDPSRPRKKITLTQTNFKNWKLLEGERWKINGENFRLINIGSNVKKEDSALNQNFVNEVRQTPDTPFEVSLSGEKLEAENFLHRLNLELADAIEEVYQRDLNERVIPEEQDAIAYAALLPEFAPEERDTLVLIREPNKEIWKLTPEEFRRSLVATLQLTGAEHNGRIFGVEGLGNLDSFPVRGNDTFDLNNLGDSGRVMFTEDKTRIQKRLTEEKDQYYFFDVTRGVKFDDSMPSEVMQALFWKLWEKGVQGKNGKPGRIIGSLDHNALRAMPYAGFTPYESFRIPPSAYDENPNRIRQEGIYFFDRTAPSAIQILDNLKDQYRKFFADDPKRASALE